MPLLPVGGTATPGTGGGGDGTPVAVTKSTYKTVRLGTIAEQDPWHPGTGAPIVTVPHGLGKVPDFYETYIECIVATSADNYVLGDRIPNVHTPWRVTVQSDATNTYIISSNSGSRFGIADKDASRTSDDFTASQWKFVAIPHIFVDTEVVTEVAGGGAELSDDDPIVESTAAPGTAATASRSDHVHPSGGVVVGGGGGSHTHTATISGTIPPTQYAYGTSALTGNADRGRAFRDPEDANMSILGLEKVVFDNNDSIDRFALKCTKAGQYWAFGQIITGIASGGASRPEIGIHRHTAIPTTPAQERANEVVDHGLQSLSWVLNLAVDDYVWFSEPWTASSRNFSNGSFILEILGEESELAVNVEEAEGGGGGGGSYLPSLDDTPTGVEDDSLWNRRGLFVQEHIKQLADSTRAFTSFDLSTAFVTVDGTLIGNVNRPGNWRGLFLEDEHAAGGVRRPAAASHNNEFGLNAANGHFELSNGTDWLEYDPFASGQPWENAYPYGAHADTTFQSGADQGKGIRITFTGKIPSIIGETGNAWELYWYLDSTVTAASGVEVEATVSAGVNFLQIKLKAIDGGADAPTLVAIVAALNSFQPGGAFAGFLCTAGYIGAVNATDKVAAAWGVSGFVGDEEASLNFANGGAGTEGVPLTHLDYWAETKTELDESWSAVGQVGLDFSGGDLHAVTAYTAPEDGGIEETIKIYRPPGYRQVVPLGRDDIRPTPGDATIGKLYLDYYRRTVTFDSEKPVAATVAEGTSLEYTNALFNGIQTAGHRVYAAGHVYYNSVTYSWHLSILDQVIFSGYVWATVDFDNLGTNAGLQNNKHWLGHWATANLAAQAIQGYSSSTRYYF